MANAKRPAWSKRITALKKKLRELSERGSIQQFLPPMSAAELEAVEAKLGVALTDEHRAFLLEVTRGEEDTGTAPLLSPEDGILVLLKESRPSAPFPFGDAEAAELIAKYQRKRRGEPGPALEGPMDGVLPVMDHGDAQYDCVVLSGPQRGKMWHSSDLGWSPLYAVKKGKAEPLDFLSWAEQQIQEALASAPPKISPDLKQLDLIGQRLTALPPAVLEAVALEKLYLSANALRELPPEIGRLTALRELVAGGCGLTALPPSIGALRELRRLVVNGNALERLPDEIGDLSELEILNASSNRLTALPERLGGLGKLVELDVSDNRIAALPECLGGLKALRALKIAKNPLTSLPESLASLPLEELSLEEMPALDWGQALRVLARVPALATLRICQPLGAAPPALDALRQVKTLRLIGLGLTELPEEVLRLDQLEKLSLDQNQLTTLPDALGQMPALKTIVLFDNPIPQGEVERLRARWPHMKIEFF